MNEVFRGPLLLLGVVALTAVPGYPRAELTPCKNHFSTEQQVQLGEKATKQVYAEMPVLPDSSPVTKYIQKLGLKLAAQAPGNKWPYNFHVADVAEINAFALPGGTVFVNLGTIQAADNEAQLAGVMAHEISHVVLQHSVCNAAKQQKVGLISGIGQIAAGVLLGGAAGELAGEGIGMTAGLGFLKMSRGAEKEADLLGVRILYDAGYDPRGMAQFFETLQAKYGQGSAQFLSDHPNPGNRSEYVEKEAATFPPRANYTTNTPAFIQIRNEVAGMRTYTAQEIASGAWKNQSPNQPVNAAVNQSANVAGPDLNTSGTWGTFQGDRFSIEVPANWQAYGNRSSAMIAPRGGIARSADGHAGTVIYGVLTDVFQPEGRPTLDDALNELVTGIVRDNPGLSADPVSRYAANGIGGRSVECNHPSAGNGRGERDWIIAFPVRNGALRYFVFVAPSPDFEEARNTFTRIAQSLKLK